MVVNDKKQIRWLTKYTIELGGVTLLIQFIGEVFIMNHTLQIRCLYGQITMRIVRKLIDC
jgi:hypothetical protein